MLQLAWPWAFILLPLPWLVRQLMPAAPPGGAGVLYAPFANYADGRQAIARSGRGNRPLLWLAIVCWVLLIGATARPQWLGDAEGVPQSGRNLMLAVDVSGSMEAADMDRSGINRLGVVKQVAGQFIEGRQGDRIGLILFGSNAYLQAPLTFDRKTVATLLRESAIGIAGRETAIGDAIGMALKRKRDTQGDMVLILLTDGANTAGHVSPEKAAELASAQGLKIHTIGVGGAPRTVRGLFGTRMLNPSAELDETTLKMIAETTGGRYFRATDRQTLTQIYTELDALEPVEQNDKVVRPVDELYPWPLGLALVTSLFLAFAARRLA